MHAPLAHWIGLLLLGAGPIYDTAVPSGEIDWTARIQQLEAETQALRSEVSTLRAQQGPLMETPVSPPLANDYNSSLADPMLSPAPSMDQVRAEIQKNAWKKGDFTIKPYGILWATASYETSRTFVGDYVMYVYPDSLEGEPAFHTDARSTRLGLDIGGPRIPFFCCAQSGGKVEIDFQRSIDSENKASVLLRHAYFEIKNEEFRLLAGQTWDVISPLYPGTLMYSVGWGGGNIGYRRAQFRADRYMALTDTFLLTAQGSINTDITSDVATNLYADHAAWPVIEGRLGTTLGPRGRGCRPIEFGVSGHIGEQVFDFRAPTWANPVDDLARRTWSLNADIRIPITCRFGVQAEFFTGENLGAYLGGILQGIDMGTPTTPGTREPIRSTGGWVDVWYDWTPRLHSHVGYSIDDPVDADVTVGRIYNSFWFANVSYDVTSKFLVGVEVMPWRTFWKGNGYSNGESFYTGFTAKYNF